MISTEKKEIRSYMPEPSSFFLVSAFVLGLTTTMSPCLFPVFPIFVNYMVGAPTSRKQGFGAGVACTSGIVTSFLAFGLVASYIGSFMIQHYSHLNVLLGLVIMLLGIIMLTPLKQIFTRLSMTNLVLNVQGTNGAFIAGAAFAFIAAPCAAPALLGIVLLASLRDVLWASIQMVLFALGAGTPFLFVGLVAQKMDRPLSGRYASYLVRWSSHITGAILIAIGGVLVVQYLIL